MNDIPYSERTREHWRWRSADGQLWTLDTVKDDHLLAIERHLMGRGDIHFEVHPGQEESWRFAYDQVRDEIARRGLQILTEDHPLAAIRRLARTGARR